MKAKSINAMIKNYHAMERKVAERVKQELSSGKNKPAASYAQVSCFYVEEDKLCVEVRYYGSYEGSSSYYEFPISEFET